MALEVGRRPLGSNRLTSKEKREFQMGELWGFKISPGKVWGWPAQRLKMSLRNNWGTGQHTDLMILCGMVESSSEHLAFGQEPCCITLP